MFLSKKSEYLLPQRKEKCNIFPRNTASNTMNGLCYNKACLCHHCKGQKPQREIPRSGNLDAAFVLLRVGFIWHRSPTACEGR